MAARISPPTQRANPEPVRRRPHYSGPRFRPLSTRQDAPRIPTAAPLRRPRQRNHHKRRSSTFPNDEKTSQHSRTPPRAYRSSHHPELPASKMIYQYEGDCDPHYKARFVFDYNMLYADAFPQQVHAVTLWLIDPESGAIVWHGTESGEALSADGYMMDLPVSPGATSSWHGAARAQAHTSPADPTHHTHLTATLGRHVRPTPRHPCATTSRPSSMAASKRRPSPTTKEHSSIPCHSSRTPTTSTSSSSTSQARPSTRTTSPSPSPPPTARWTGTTLLSPTNS